MRLKNKNILLCLTGSIACYKSIDLYRNLKKRGANVKIIVSSAASKFVSPYIFESFGDEVYSDDVFKTPLSHISLSKFADLILIAPATLNTINKIASGIADNLITLSVSASGDKPVMIVPAMNPAMYSNKILLDNLSKLEAQNFKIVSPGTGKAACGEFGEGRFPDIDDIMFEVECIFADKKLEDRKVLVTAGGTREYIDPVRFISNASSGKMGISIANEAARRGAEVSLIALNVDFDIVYASKKINIVKCPDFKELRKVLPEMFSGCDILFMAAAVSDYSVGEKSNEKIKKNGEGLNLALKENEDLLKLISGIKNQKQTVVGFAAETVSAIENGRKKLSDKSLDYIFVNDVSKDVIGGDENEGFLLNKYGDIKKFERTSKNCLARKLISEMRF